MNEIIYYLFFYTNGLKEKLAGHGPYSD